MMLRHISLQFSDVTPLARNLQGPFLRISEFLPPGVIGEVNDVYVNFTTVTGDVVPWPSHVEKEEMCYVVRGSLRTDSENRPGRLPTWTVQVPHRRER